MMPERTKLCKAAAKKSKMLKWADGRAAFEVVPDLVKNDWGIDLRDKPSCSLALFPVNSSIFDGVIERPADRATIMGVAVHHHGQMKGAEPCIVFS